MFSFILNVFKSFQTHKKIFTMLYFIKKVTLNKIKFNSPTSNIYNKLRCYTYMTSLNYLKITTTPPNSVDTPIKLEDSDSQNLQKTPAHSVDKTTVPKTPLEKFRANIDYIKRYKTIITQLNLKICQATQQNRCLKELAGKELMKEKEIKEQNNKIIHEKEKRKQQIIIKEN